MSKKKKNILKTAVVGGLALLSVGAIATTTYHYKDVIKDKINEWFDNDKNGDNIIVDGQEEQGGTTLNYMPSNIAFRKASNKDTALTINAQVIPESATVKTLTWSLSWVTTNAENVNDYITLSVGSDTHIVSIKVLKLFSTAINLTATANNGINATCKLDFLKQINSFSFSIDKTTSDDEHSEHLTISSNTLYFNYDNKSIVYDDYDYDGTFEEEIYLYNSFTQGATAYYENLDSYNYYFYPIQNISNNCVGTVGSIENSKSLSYGCCSMTLTDNAISTLNSVGLSKYIDSDGWLLDNGDECSMVECFSQIFTTTDTDTSINILKALQSVEGSIFQYNFAFDSVLNNSVISTQRITYMFRPQIFIYSPVISVSLSGNTVLS